jgi:hypothetical protein
MDAVGAALLAARAPTTRAFTPVFGEPWGRPQNGNAVGPAVGIPAAALIFPKSWFSLANWGADGWG